VAVASTLQVPALKNDTIKNADNRFTTNFKTFFISVPPFLKIFCARAHFLYNRNFYLFCQDKIFIL
jgi:hypothetical protein